MRRKEREITDLTEIKSIMDKCFSLHLGINDKGHVYVVPVNFGYAEENGKFTFYFHGAAAGRKYELLKNGCNLGFEMDCDGQIIEGEIACKYSAAYSSVIGEGKAELVTDVEEKKLGLNLIMKKATGKGNWNYPSIMLEKVCVFKIQAEEISCKAHKF